MKSLSLRLTDPSFEKLTAASVKAGKSKSELARQAIHAFIEKNEQEVHDSCLDVAGDLAGSVEGPSDLSCQASHLDGYGQ